MKKRKKHRITDKMRLDWLQSINSEIFYSGRNIYGIFGLTRTVRQAIDAEIRKTTKRGC